MSMLDTRALVAAHTPQLYGLWAQATDTDRQHIIEAYEALQTTYHGLGLVAQANDCLAVIGTLSAKGVRA